MPKSGDIQTPLVTNLNILGYLKKKGQLWSNVNQIATGVAGSSLHRGRTREILNNFLKLGLVEMQTENPQAHGEYRLTLKGLAEYQKLVNFVNNPETKFILGLGKQDYE